MRQLAIGKGFLGFWAALQEEYGQVAQQRCWVHKTANTLDKMPKKKSCARSSADKQS
jgi:putative transposase